MAADDKEMIAGVGKQVDRLMDEADSREQSFTDLLAFLKKKAIDHGGDALRLARNGLGHLRIRIEARPLQRGKGISQGAGHRNEAREADPVAGRRASWRRLPTRMTWGR